MPKPPAPSTRTISNSSSFEPGSKASGVNASGAPAGSGGNSATDQSPSASWQVCMAGLSTADRLT